MILIVTALKIEATPLIKLYKLKKDVTVPNFPVFRNKDMALIISGTGKIRSAMATVFLMSLYGGGGANTSLKTMGKNPPAQHFSKTFDKILLVNVGFCGSFSEANPLGNLFQINHIRDMDTSRNYYPDIYADCHLLQSSLGCYSRPVSRDMDVSEPPQRPSLDDKNATPLECQLCDMESSGIMEAAQSFLATHQVLMLKLVSDYLVPQRLDLDCLEEYLDRNLGAIDQAIQATYQQILSLASNLFVPEQDKLFQVTQRLHFTQAMEQQLDVLVRRATLAKVDVISILSSTDSIIVTTKAEGRKVFEQLKQQLS